jgi:hypothetical protein
VKRTCPCVFVADVSWPYGPSVVPCTTPAIRIGTPDPSRFDSVRGTPIDIIPTVTWHNGVPDPDAYFAKVE